MHDTRSGQLTAVFAVGSLLLFGCSSSSPSLATEPPTRGEEGGTPPPPMIGAKAVSTLHPLSVSTILTEDGFTREVACRGKATLVVTPDGTNLTLTVDGCDFKAYPVAIHTEGTCDGPLAPDTFWEAPRAGGIPRVACTRGGHGNIYYTRLHTHAKAWSIAASDATSLLGKRLVVHDPHDMRAMACGVIAPAVAEPAPSSIPLVYQAAVANQCAWKQIARSSTHDCPDPQELVDCANENCELSSCLEQCSAYVSCLEEAGDECSFDCFASDPCTSCRSKMVQCIWGFCADAIGCAAPVAAGGACSKIEACCRKQGDFAPMCLDMLDKVVQVSGEPTCIGWLNDWDWNTNMRVPCSYEQNE